MGPAIPRSDLGTGRPVGADPCAQQLGECPCDANGCRLPFWMLSGEERDPPKLPSFLHSINVYIGSGVGRVFQGSGPPGAPDHRSRASHDRSQSWGQMCFLRCPLGQSSVTRSAQAEKPPEWSQRNDCVFSGPSRAFQPKEINKNIMSSKMFCTWRRPTSAPPPALASRPASDFPHRS